LREALHAIETDKKKERTTPKLESKDLKPDITAVLNESSAAGLVRMFQEGAKLKE
jgi:hypothetical protein